MLNQPLGDRWGSLYFSGYTQDYWGYSGRDTEYQAGYTNSFKQVNYGISASRQYGVDSGQGENTYMLNFSLPLGSGGKAQRSQPTGTQERGVEGNGWVDRVNIGGGR